MSDNKKKYALSTDTDLHLDMLADQTKLKLMPNLTNVNNKLNNIDELNSDSESDDIMNNNSRYNK